MAAYLEACLEEADGHAAFIAKALGDIARAKGMSQVARDAGLSRESLYKALSGERSPDFDTILKVLKSSPRSGSNCTPQRVMADRPALQGTRALQAVAARPCSGVEFKRVTSRIAVPPAPTLD